MVPADDVIPDIVWVSSRRLATILWQDGKLHAAPELVVEVLSPGSFNERRDREIKLNLYSRRGVDEYWIVDLQSRNVAIFRRRDQLVLTVTLSETECLTTPLLEGFTCPVAEFFARIL